MPAPCSTRQKDTSGLPPTPVTVDLPTFSMAVTLNLNKGALDGRAWRNLVGETANYYILFYEFAQGNSATYRIIGQKMYAKFPCIKRDGNKPWIRVFQVLIII